MQQQIPEKLPIIAVDNYRRILFPGILVRLKVENEACLQSSRSDLVAVLPLKFTKHYSRSTSDDPNTNPEIKDADLYDYGVAGRVVSNKRGMVTVEGLCRIQVLRIRNHVATVKVLMDEADWDDMELKAAVATFEQGSKELLESLSKSKVPPIILQQLSIMLKDSVPGRVADLLASVLDLSASEKLEILKSVDLKQRLSKMIHYIKRQIQVFSLSQKLSNSVQEKLGAKQRELMLREQLEAIKKELGEIDGTGSKSDDLEAKIERLPEEPRMIAKRELARMKRMSSSMADYQVTRTYIETICELPWTNSTVDNLNIASAQKVLTDDHFGLEKVKSRIIEYLCVRKLSQYSRGPILCLVGPPGVGKTSLGKSIASALGRKFYRIALGGVRDEAEIRGHRRTYVGALPGVILNALKRCGTNNPVLLLDEVDKLSTGARGDPQSALLEVLDPEQNNTFTDHYLAIPFDLSQVIFICTANDSNTIAPPLLDRMECLNLSSYTINEKVLIARKYLIPKQAVENGISFPVEMDDNTLEFLTTSYTREPGVRGLERAIGSVCRRIAVEYVEARDNGALKYFKPAIDLKKIEEILGTPIYEHEVKARKSIPGVVTGLAWTPIGTGEILFIETLTTAGSGKLLYTGYGY